MGQVVGGRKSCSASSRFSPAIPIFRWRSRRPTSPAPSTWATCSSIPSSMRQVRWRRMCGERTLWLPGTDHAGIATRAHGRPATGRSRAHKARPGPRRVSKQRLGMERPTRRPHRRADEARRRSCDWSRERFTLDPGFSRAVREAFVRLYEKGLIYQRQLHRQLVPALPDRAVGSGSGARRDARPPVAHRAIR